MRWWTIRSFRALLAMLWVGAGVGFAVMMDSRPESAPVRHLFLFALLVVSIALVAFWGDDRGAGGE